MKPTHPTWPGSWNGSELASNPAWSLRHGTVAPQAIRHSLESESGVVRLSGFPIADRTDAQLAEDFLGFVATLGTPVSQDIDGTKVFRVEDAGFSDDDPRMRGPNSRRALTFHTDRCDVIGFLCVRQAMEGGQNLLASSARVHNLLLERDPDLLAALYEPFFWKRHNFDTANALPWCELPIFSKCAGFFACCVMQVLIERAHAMEALPDLTTRQRAALDALQQIASDPAVHLRFRLEPGQVLLVNNLSVLHSRCAYSAAPAAGPGRLLLRAWLSMPNSRPLDPALASLFGHTAAGTPRGGIRTSR